MRSLWTRPRFCHLVMGLKQTLKIATVTISLLYHFQPMIREGAVAALRAALAVTSQREGKASQTSQWYKVGIFICLSHYFKILHFQKISRQPINPLPNDKFLNWFKFIKFKAFSDNKINVT